MGIIFFILFWALSPTSPGYGSREDLQLLFALQTLLSHKFDSSTSLAFKEDWQAWFSNTFVEPFPTGLIYQVADDRYAQSAVANVTPPGMLYNSHIMFLGDIRLERRRRVALKECPYTIDENAQQGLLPHIDLRLQNACVCRCEEEERRRMTRRRRKGLVSRVCLVAWLLGWCA